jgi:hypothetical protein
MVTPGEPPDRVDAERRVRQSRRIALRIVLVVLGLWLAFWVFIFYTRGDLDRMLTLPGKPEVRYRVSMGLAPPVGETQVEFMFPVPLLDGQVHPGLREALAALEPPLEIVDTEHGPFVRLTTENINQYGGLGADLTIPVDKRAIGSLTSSRFSMSGASETSPGRYWVYLDSGGLQSSIFMLCGIGTPTGKPVMYFLLRLDSPPQSAGWVEVEGE